MQSPVVTLDQLDDDCLECVFERVHNLQMQVQIAQVCRRFQTIIARMWRRDQNFKTLCLTEWRQWLPHEKDLMYFMNVMHDCLINIQVVDECLHAFLTDLQEALSVNVSCLPSVERFEFIDMPDCYAADDDILELTKLFCNLKYLRITASTSGHNLVKFQLLEELHLYADSEKENEIENENLREICEHLKHLRVLDIRSYEISHLHLSNISKCQQLEVLKLNLNTLKPVLSEVLKLPKLKRLTVLLDNVIDVSRIQNVDTHDYKIHETAEFFEILQSKSEHLIGIAVDNYYMPLNFNWDVNLEFFKYQKLQKFAFCNSYFAADVLEKYANAMPKLELLCCRNWPHLTNDMILRFIEMCPRLLHLDISYCKNLNKSLLYGALEILQKQKRNPLNVYYLLSGMEDEIEKVNYRYWNTQKYITFSIDFPPDSDKGLSYVQRGYEFDFE